MHDDVLRIALVSAAAAIAIVAIGGYVLRPSSDWWKGFGMGVMFILTPSFVTLAVLLWSYSGDSDAE